MRFISFALCLMVAACQTTPTLTPAISPTPDVTSATATPVSFTPTPEALGTNTAITPVVPDTRSVSVWLPSTFATGAAPLAPLEAQLQSAGTQAQVSVTVRIKADSGAGSLLNALLSAYSVAPDSLPDLVLLSREDLVRAANARVILALDEQSAEDPADHYPFAQALSQVDGLRFGIPIAANARVLAYSTDLYPAPPRSWSDLITGTLVVPSDENTGLTLLHNYLALGGSVMNANGQVALDANLLGQALVPYQQLQVLNVLTVGGLGYPTPKATWQAFRDRRASLAVIQISDYLADANRLSGTSASLIPTPNNTPMALATGWSWAMVNRGPAQHPNTVPMLSQLTTATAIAQWTQITNLLPTRTSALEAWGRSANAPLAAAILTNAQLQPPLSTLEIIGPALRQALRDVVSGQSSPSSAAQTAAQSITQP